MDCFHQTNKKVKPKKQEKKKKKQIFVPFYKTKEKARRKEPDEITENPKKQNVSSCLPRSDAAPSVSPPDVDSVRPREKSRPHPSRSGRR